MRQLASSSVAVSLALTGVLLTAHHAAPSPAYAQDTGATSVDIIVHKGPAVLVQVAGDPVLLPVDEAGTVERVANASGELYRDPAGGTYWTRLGKQWVGASTIDGAYGKQRGLPRTLSTLPAPPAQAPVPKWKSRDPAPVYVRTRRSVLITLEGNLALERIGELGGVHVVTNTDADLFFYGRNARYYLLAGGCWYTSTHVDAAWEPVPAPPKDFAQIPPEHPRGYVLAAIPGTPEHAAAIDEVARMSLREVRSDATTTVTYDGTPVFLPVEGTALRYAVNTAQDVFAAGGLYYCCAEGVWYLAAAPTGPWSVCAVVPDALYDLPPSHPKHHVTRVLMNPAEKPGYVMVGADAKYAGWSAEHDRLVHRTWRGPFPSGVVHEGVYYGPYARGEYLAPEYGNWGRGTWTADLDRLRAGTPPTPASAPAAAEDRWNAEQRKADLEGPGGGRRWYGDREELEERRRSSRGWPE